MRTRSLVLAAAAAFMASLAQAGDFAGNWSGSIEIRFGDGREVKDTAWLQLDPHGDRVTGGAGPAPDRLKPIRDGAVHGAALTFDTDGGGGKSFHFDLHLERDRLVGDASVAPDDGTRVHIELSRHAEATPHDALFEEIAAADAKLFDAFNRRDVDGVMSMFTRDLEFYHDRGGFSDYAQNRKQFSQALAESTHHRRELVPASLKVSALGPEFALETGSHRFYDTPPGEPERLAATADFVNVWQRTKDGWRLRRVISYDHR